jgi:hypothetical protein
MEEIKEIIKINKNIVTAVMMVKIKFSMWIMSTQICHFFLVKQILLKQIMLSVKIKDSEEIKTVKIITILFKTEDQKHALIVKRKDIWFQIVRNQDVIIKIKIIIIKSLRVSIIKTEMIVIIQTIPIEIKIMPIDIII